MKNLAGETKADLHILEELNKAGIEVVEGERSKGEVPYTLTGKLGNWNFARAWYYWKAGEQDGKGLPLEVAIELHNREYPLKGEGERKPKTYGQVIRVNGDCGCSKPTRMIGFYHVDTQEGLNALAKAICTSNDITSSGNNPKDIKRLQDKISSLYVEWETSDKQGDVEWLKKIPTITYDNGSVVNELLVAIKGGDEVASIAKKWEITNGRKGIVQHFFKANLITGFNYGHISGPGQILNRGPEVDERIRPHYEELKTLRPKAADSLELCMQELEKPGSEYKKIGH